MVMESIEYGNLFCWCFELEYGWMVDFRRIIRLSEMVLPLYVIGSWTNMSYLLQFITQAALFSPWISHVTLLPLWLFGACYSKNTWTSNLIIYVIRWRTGSCPN